MAEVSKQLTEHVAPHSVEISRNAKGDYSYDPRLRSREARGEPDPPHDRGQREAGSLKEVP
jgi:hypothetical protein